MSTQEPEFCPKCGGPLVKEADRELPCFNCVPIVNVYRGQIKEEPCLTKELY
jgi:hypothetical protein